MGQTRLRAPPQIQLKIHPQSSTLRRLSAPFAQTPLMKGKDSQSCSQAAAIPTVSVAYETNKKTQIQGKMDAHLTLI